jgi:hypothetical protein
MTMRIRKLRIIVGTLSWIMALSLAGCRSAQQPSAAEVKAAAERADVADEARGVAEAVLGKQAEILARGDLALNGREQLLVVNRISKQAGSGGGANSSILVTRAAVLEQNGGKWSEVLLCDEHLKNPNGYLGGSPVGRINDWQLEFSQDAKDGLEMKFSPADPSDGLNAQTGEQVGPERGKFDVRWNKNAKRYQSFDQSHERYLSEVPSLETPQSILK